MELICVRQIDSLIINDAIEIRKNTIEQIIKPYLNTPIGIRFDQISESLVKRYYFISEKPEYNFGLIDSKKLGAVFSLNPQFNSLFTGIVGFSRNSRLQFMGEVNMHFENLMKNAESLDLYWEKIDSSSQVIKAGSFFPHPFGLDMGLDLKYHYEIFNGLFTKNENRLMLH